MQLVNGQCHSEILCAPFEIIHLRCTVHGWLADMGENPSITDLQNEWVKHVNKVEGR